jgi:hypothetical protein
MVNTVRSRRNASRAGLVRPVAEELPVSVVMTSSPVRRSLRSAVLVGGGCGADDSAIPAAGQVGPWSAKLEAVRLLAFGNGALLNTCRPKCRRANPIDRG